MTTLCTFPLDIYFFPGQVATVGRVDPVDRVGLSQAHAMA